jgi:ligand-binding sensor domain-containing protein
MRNAHIYTLLLMFVFNTSSNGQNKPDLPKENIKPKTKDLITSLVPYSMVRNIKQARNGNILIASWRGIFRYNGKSFTNLTSKISSPSFWDVLEDRKGNLWSATRDSGVYCYNGKSFKHFTTRDGLASDMVFSIYEDKNGNIWFGTSGGASRYDGKSFQNSKEMLLLEDKTGKLWFGTSDGPRIYDGKTFTTLTNNGKPVTNVGTIIEDKKGNIWLGGNDGLWRYDGRTLTKVSQRGVYALIEDKKGNIWTTGEVTPNGYWALSRYDQKTLYNKKPTVTEIMSKKGNSTFCGILGANDGSIWVGSVGAGSGLYRYDGKTVTNFMSKEGQQ